MKRLLSTRNDTCPPLRFQQSAKAHQSDQELTGKDGFLTLLIKQLTEDALSAELESHLAQDVEANRKNGSGKKTIKAPTGTFELATLRDRNGTFEPQLVKKYQTTLSDEIEYKIIRLFALGMSYQDISREICLQRFNRHYQSGNGQSHP